MNKKDPSDSNGSKLNRRITVIIEHFIKDRFLPITNLPREDSRILFLVVGDLPLDLRGGHTGLGSADDPRADRASLLRGVWEAKGGGGGGEER